jgi:hypothetical protein
LNRFCESRIDFTLHFSFSLYCLTPIVTLGEALDIVAQLSTEEQDMLLTIVKNRLREQWREELAVYVQETQAALRRGDLRPQSAEKVVSDLRVLLEHDGDAE